MKILLLVLCSLIFVSCGKSSSSSSKKTRQNQNQLVESDLFGTWETNCILKPFPKKIVMTFTADYKFTQSNQYFSMTSTDCKASDLSMESSQEATYKVGDLVEKSIYALELTVEQAKTAYYTIKVNSDNTILLSNGASYNPNVHVVSYDEAEKLHKISEE